MFALDFERDDEYGRATDRRGIDHSHFAFNDTLFVQATQAALNGRRRKRRVFSPAPGGLAGVLLHQIQQLAIEAVEFQGRR
jgi:hypothetical protein